MTTLVTIYLLHRLINPHGGARPDLSGDGDRTGSATPPPLTEARNQMITIDKDSALAHLRAVVEEFGPDHKATCQYATINGAVQRPCCIVGQVFSRAGVPSETLTALDNSGTGSSGTDIVTLATRGVLEGYGIDLTHDAVLVLRAAQRKQDADYGWGAAVDEAEEKAAALPGAFYGPGQADGVACQGDVVTL